jgi:membrane peptidoglycan carboxypeptidase
MVRPSGRREGGVVPQLLLFLVVSVVSGLLLAGLALPVVGGLGLGARSAADTFQPSSLETPPLPQQSRIVAADGSLIATFYEQDRIDVPLSRVAPIMRKAIIAIEDSRFYEHGGLDLRGTLRAALANRNSEETQGGSSLTQQYVKNVLLQAAVARGDEEAKRQATVSEGSEGLARKLRELQYAVALEDTLQKDQILERYLNIAYFGENAYGIEAASRRYFSKPASRLTLPEAALLAGIVRSPSAYSPLQTSKNAKKRVQIAERVKGRRDVVINRMVELGYVTAKVGAQAKASKIVTKPSKISSGCANARQAPFFCDYIERQILANPIFGKTAAARRNLLFRGGVTVKTSLDPKMQRAAQAAVDKYFDPRDVPVGSMVMLEPGTGLVKAMAVSKGFGNDKLRQTTLNLAADKSNYSESAGSQSGSTFKPFVAAAALEQGYGFNYSIYSPAKLTRPVKVAAATAASSSSTSRTPPPTRPSTRTAVTRCSRGWSSPSTPTGCRWRSSPGSAGRGRSPTGWACAWATTRGSRSAPTRRSPSARTRCRRCRWRRRTPPSPRAASPAGH